MAGSVGWPVADWCGEQYRAASLQRRAQLGRQPARSRTRCHQPWPDPAGACTWPAGAGDLPRPAGGQRGAGRALASTRAGGARPGRSSRRPQRTAGHAIRPGPSGAAATRRLVGRHERDRAGVGEFAARAGYCEACRWAGGRSHCTGWPDRSLSRRRAGLLLAVQWHPEWRVTQHPFYRAIFQAFGEACRQYAAQRGQ